MRTLEDGGLPLPALIQKLRLERDGFGETEIGLASEAMRRAAIRAVDDLVEEHGLPALEAVTVKRFFNSRASNWLHTSLSADNEARLWIGAAVAQREVLINLWQDGEIGDDVLGRLEREIDLAESRLARDDASA